MSGRMTSFLGGSPLSVAVRLLVISLLVGVVLSWLDLRPTELFNHLVYLLESAWLSVFGSLNRTIDYVLMGAAIVVPIFLISRFIKTRG
ncbi:hypothetical protein NS365_18010 [Aureimonas ureilytica]|uniref:DUF6460 domain-containing protein n=1 Tax=Aureimonas ureilytica TaxID=401562 RepID=A0A175RIH7_9HYPH|nr:DUF6460 domain-containing protein [Aureimonas ureilytica]KTR03575.1 hypothetical protein NS365_18010 [Aureimonas ureilytica]